MAGSWWHPVRVCWINETQAPYQWFLTLVTHLITCSIQFSRSVMSNSLQPHGLQYARLPCPLKLMSIESVMPSNHLIFCRPFLLLPSIFPSIRVFSSESVLCIRWPNIGVSASASQYSGLISSTIDWFDLLAVQRNSQESSPTPQFKSINSSVLSFLYSPILTSIHDYWKNHSFD